MRLVTCILLAILFVMGASAQSKSKKKQASKTELPTIEIPSSYKDRLANAQQAIAVSMAGWNTNTGTLTRWERTENAWAQAGDAIPVTIGKDGLGWDALIEPPAVAGEPVKKEGDGRSPSGIFLLTTAFGFAPDSPDSKFPYHPLTEGTNCVDDSNSRHYNRIVELHDVSYKDWDSSEQMRTITPQYEIGVVVDYNDQKVPGAGSCIFLHVWKSSTDPTAGCTAMDKDNLQEIISWLDEKKSPVLIQFTAPWYERLQSDWKLPPLTSAKSAARSPKE